MSCIHASRSVAVALFVCTLVAARVALGSPPAVPLNDMTGVAADVRPISDSVNRFALDLYKQARAKESNLFLSPASIAAVLAMAMEGADGNTKQEMASLLHIAETAPGQAGFGKLNELLNSADPQGSCVLRSANRLWGDEKCSFLPSFLRQTREMYGADLKTVDFNRPEAARREINDWISSRTQGKIPELISPGAFDPLTRLVLTNAVYFKGRWKEEFQVQATRKKPFHAGNGKTYEVPTMANEEFFPYFENDQLQILELPYVGQRVSMVVILPRERDGLAALEKSLTNETLAKWTAEAARREVIIFLPKFKMHSSTSLAPVLTSLGMRAAFTPAADFSKMTSAEPLWISDVLHSAHVDVNEQGTEAAAGTATIGTTAGPPREPPVFRADHPFLFLLRENESGAILFIGRLADPTS